MQHLINDGSLLDESLPTHLGCTDNVFEVFKQAIFVLIWGLWLHLSDTFDLALQDKESLVIKVNAFVLQ